jgi:hypothetical protein
MTGETSRKSAKMAKRVAAKAAKPRKGVAKSPAGKPTKAVAKEVSVQNVVPRAATKSKGPAPSAKPTLLSGGNPQIAKAYGDAPVQAYIAAMPDWKSDIGRRLDALIVRTVPTCTRQSSGTRRSTDSRARAGSSASIASRSMSRWLSSAARRYFPFLPASLSRRKCATSTSTRTTSSTKLNSPIG